MPKFLNQNLRLPILTKELLNVIMKNPNKTKELLIKQHNLKTNYNIAMMKIFPIKKEENQETTKEALSVRPLDSYKPI